MIKPLRRRKVRKVKNSRTSRIAESSSYSGYESTYKRAGKDLTLGKVTRLRKRK